LTYLENAAPDLHLTTITHEEFVHRMSAAKLGMNICHTSAMFDYFYAYIYGLRRHYHGEQFGSDEKLTAFIKRGGASRVGLEDALAGKICDFQRFLD
jgi:hypothetical protein